MTLPYANATSGASARAEILRILKRFGCARVAFLDEFHPHGVVLSFEIHGWRVQMRASASGWAAAFLRENPWTSRHKRSRQEYERAALNQGAIAIESILRDWVKGQVTAVETGMLQFDEVFAAHTICADGRPAIEHFRERLQLAAPEKYEDDRR